MLFRRNYRLKFSVLVTTLVVLMCSSALAGSDVSSEEAAKLLPDRIEDFRGVGPAKSVPAFSKSEFEEVPDAAIERKYYYRRYESKNGERLSVLLTTESSESAAYSLLTQVKRAMADSRGKTPIPGPLGAASYVLPGTFVFSQGRNWVQVINDSDRQKSEPAIALASSLARSLPKGEEEIPVLVRHLPQWDDLQREHTYFVTLDALKSSIKSPVFNVLNFEGAEAVNANYNSSQLLVIEFATPQLATENDQRILAKLQELRTQGQPVPTAYKRVGNYGAFVFNAESEQAANQLIDQIKYEYVTKWLGDSPYPLLEAQRAYRDRTLGVLVSVVKASGLALVVCLSAGAIFGGLLFMYRRAQQKANEAYSDAGGMLRLNLDEMTPQNDPARLIGPGG
jgi:Family of unknown function (DUF6599)